MAIGSVLDEQLEQRSKSLFGNRHMLRVARDVGGRHQRFTAKDVASATQVPYSTTHRLIRRLELLGLVEQAALGEDESAGQERWLDRGSHDFWRAVEQLYSASTIQVNADA